MSELIRQKRIQLKNPGRLYSLDLLRFLAALLVVLYHFSYRGNIGGFTEVSLLEISGWSKYGFLGVDLFFIISGFVIAWSADKHSLERFIGSRFMRLYPGFLAGVTITFIATLIMGGDAFQSSLSQYFANLTLLPQLFGLEFMDGVYWSIVVEIIFYAWIALLVGTGLFRRFLPEIIALWLIIAMLNEFVFFIDALRLPFMTPFAGFFAGGIMLYRWKLAGKSDNWEKLLFTTAVFYSVMIESKRGITWGDSFSADLDRLTLMGVTASLFLVFYAFIHWKISAKTGEKLAILGSLSYPLYLIHQNIGYMLLNKLSGIAPSWLLIMVVTIVLIVMSALIAKYIEPFGRSVLKPVVAATFKLVHRLPYARKVLSASAG